MRLLLAQLTIACVGLAAPPVLGHGPHRDHATDACDASDNLSRRDCFPENGASQDACEARGCCWRQPTLNADADDNVEVPVNVPYCFYPPSYQGYEVLNQTETDLGATIFLRRKTPSQIALDVALLRVDVVRQADDILRFKVADAQRTRWEPPLPKRPAPAAPALSATTAGQPAYAFQVQDNNLQVYRTTTTGEDDDEDATMVASFNLGAMVYTDNFIQITNKLPSSVVYGLGEHKGSLRRSVNYTRLTFYNMDQPPDYNTRLYGAHPLYINIESDGRANGVWLLNSNAMDVILTPEPAITYRPVGGVLDFFVFMGPSPKEVVQQYQQMVGRPKMIPYWSLGFHLCRFGYKSTDDTRQTLQRNLDAGVRIDVQWNDIDYMDQRNDFTLDPVNFHDLGDFVDDLHKDGRHYVMIIDPAVSGSEPAGEYPPYDRGLDYDVFVKDIHGKVVKARVWNLKSSVFPDFTHPNATPYWTEMFQNFHQEVAFDGAWIDMNEPSNMLTGHMDEGCPDDNGIVYTPGDVPLQTKTLCNTDQQYWSSHYNVHNMYGFTEAISTYKALSTIRPNKRPFIISRSTFSGSGFYTGHWTGDVSSTWTDLKESVPGTLEFSFYGIPMVGADICGFNGETTVELCARWQALGAFYPFSRNHNTDTSNPQDPASMGDQVLTVTRNAYYWRYKLLPFLYTLFYRAHVYGETVARPLFFDNADDPNTFDNSEQFLWGGALMVTPALYEGQQTIDAYFPKGVWYDLQNRTGTVDASAQGKTQTLEAYEDTINFFMKGGHSVFFQKPGNTTTDSRQNPFGLYVFLCQMGESAGEVYVDDGESIDAIQAGNYRVYKVVANTNTLLLGLPNGDHEPNHGDGDSTDDVIDRIHVYGIKSQPKQITLNQQPFTAFDYDQDLQLLTMYHLNQDMNDVQINFVY